MNFKRLCKSILCLALACFLVFNIVTIPARATGALAVIEGIVTVLGPVGTVAAVSVIALGLWAGANPDDFDNIVNGVSGHMSEIGTNMKDGFVQMLQVTDSAGAKQLYIAAEWLENVRSWLFDSGTLSVSESYVFPNSTSEKIAEAYATAMSYPYHCVAYNTTNLSWHFICSEGPILFAPKDGGGYWIYTEEKTWYSYKLNGTNYTKTANGTGSKTGTFDRISETGLVEDIVCSSDLTLGVVSNSAIVNDVSVYDSAWNANQLRVALADPENNEPEYKVYFPVPLPSTYDELYSLTQSDVLSGGVLITPDLEQDEEYKIEELPLVDGYQGVLISPSDTQSGTQSGTQTGTVSLPGWVRDGFNNLKNGLDDLLNSLKNLPSALWALIPAWIQEGLSNMIVGLRDILDAIVALPGRIAEAIAEVLANALTKAFAVSDTFIASKVEELTMKYPYLDTFLALGVDLKGFFFSLGTKPPIIYIDLGSATGSYLWGGKQAFIDLSWYAQYKPTMDSILSAFLWLWFAWRLYLSLPGLIAGTNGMWGPKDNNIGTHTIDVPRRLNSGSDAKQLGTSEYHSRGTSGKHYTKHEGL